MPIETLSNLFIKIFIMIAFGYFLKKVNVIDDGFQKKLSNLLVNAVLPINILAVANNEFTKEFSEKLIQSMIISSGYYIVSLIIMTVLCKFIFTKNKKTGIFITLSVFANTAFLGFPLVKELYGYEGNIYAIVYNLFYNIFFFTYGAKLLSGMKRIQWKLLMKNATAVASVAALLLFVSPFRFPKVIVSTFNEIGSMMVPLSMIIIGSSLADIKLIEILKNKYSYIVSFSRLLLFPMIMFAVLKVLGADTILASTCILITALPAGSLNVIFAEKYDYEPEFATTTVVQSTVLMMLTLPLVIMMIGNFF